MGRGGDKVRLKWPNDIYAVVGDDGTGAGARGMKKLGGVLVNTNFSGGKIDVLIGEFMRPCSFLASPV